MSEQNMKKRYHVTLYYPQQVCGITPQVIIDQYHVMAEGNKLPTQETGYPDPYQHLRQRFPADLVDEWIQQQVSGEKLPIQETGYPDPYQHLRQMFPADLVDEWIQQVPGRDALPRLSRTVTPSS
ncbi:uncharacterized protein LOC117341136 [Pecten maximus]|uniref:uncharacterized protein LOC117341136 n=1 Tax=Pecten maximus TaxID=6579 RepID=UPI001458D28B|nr:uncharacterized protein LOC117341136 [Pecten maximus]